MPYIITTWTTRPQGGLPYDTYGDDARHAVATLEEARSHALDIMWPHDYVQHAKRFEVTAAINALPEQGGTIGPLPDGTVIEVAPTTWAHLMERAPEQQVWAGDYAAIIDTYNAAV